jgi:hypothetical protein
MNLSRRSSSSSLTGLRAARERGERCARAPNSVRQQGARLEIARDDALPRGRRRTELGDDDGTFHLDEVDGEQRVAIVAVVARRERDDDVVHRPFVERRAEFDELLFLLRAGLVACR